MPSVTRPRSNAESALIVAKYRRVSTPDQLEGFGLEDQDQICDGWLEQHSEADLYGDYVDEGVSGTLERRPDMDRLIMDAHKGVMNRILVPRVDRIGRTARAAYQWAWNMQDIGVCFIAVQEGIDTSTEDGWSLFAQYVRFAEMDWRRIKERTCAGRELKISYGGWPGGAAPYGYKLVNDTTVINNRRKRCSVLVTHEPEAIVLALAVSFIVDQGMNLSEAASELNRLGRLTRSGVPWTPGNLRNRLYAETIHHGYVLYRKSNRGTGKRTPLRFDDGTPAHGDAVKIGVPRVFTEARAAELMESLKKLGFQNGRHGNRVYPLTGRIVGTCGEVYTGAGQGVRGPRVYRCKGIARRDAPSCGEPHFAADDIERAVWRELTRLVEDRAHLKAMVVRPAERVPGDKAKYTERVHEFQAKITEHEQLIRRKVPEYIKANIDPTVMKAAVDKLKDDLEDYKQQHRFAREWLEKYAEHERQALNVGSIVGNVREGLDAMTLEKRKEVMEMLDIQVRVGDASDTRKPGVKCAVCEWHWETGTKVPHDPTDTEWKAVLEILRPLFTKRHFTSKYDIRQQFCGMLHRLRQGLPWTDMPDTWGPVGRIRERQLAWWQKGAWPKVMAALKANERGVEAYQRRTLPELNVSGQLGDGLLVEVRIQSPGPKG